VELLQKLRELQAQRDLQLQRDPERERELAAQIQANLVSVAGRIRPGDENLQRVLGISLNPTPMPDHDIMEIN
jgi:hypothetical protein